MTRSSWPVLVCLSVLFWLHGAAVLRAQPVLSFDEQSSLFEIRDRSVPIVKANFVFWRGNWQWIGLGVKSRREGDRYRLTSTKNGKVLSLSGAAAKADPRTMIWRLHLADDPGRKGILRGGIVFKINVSAFASTAFTPTPELMSDASGWRLRMGPGKPPIEIRFAPKSVRVFFERGNRNEVRAFFYDVNTPPRPQDIRMTVTLPAAGHIAKPLSDRFAPPSRKTWHRALMKWDRSPVDLSFLNAADRPAGKHGFLKAVGLGLRFEDGTPARFWGTNLTAYALFRTSKRAVKRQARRLAQLGFNLVRIHHHDSAWVRPNIFGNRANNTRTLDDAALDKLDWWIKALKDEGIYVWLDLEVGRQYTSQDGIRYFDEIAKGKPSATAKGFNYINEDLMRRMEAFATAYLSHVNAYTGTAYKDEPAIAALLITNENDLSHHFGNALLPNKNVPQHNRIYMRAAERFARQWGLSPKQTWRSWNFGPSKLFLADLEHRFNVRMIAHLRALGVKVPIATTNSWGRMTLAGLASLTDGNIVDVHSYGSVDAFSANPQYRANFVDWLAAAQVVGKPLSVTEWNVSPFPTADRATVPPYVAAVARLQGWDAIMHYAYAQVSLDNAGRPGNWNAYNDPAMLALMPAAALLFRQGHVKKARRTYALSFGDRIFNAPIAPNTSVALRSLAEQSRLAIDIEPQKSLPWLHPKRRSAEAIPVTDPGRDFLPKNATSVTSDTGELRRDWKDGGFTVDTPRSQIAAGWIGGQRIVLGDVTIASDTANAAIAVQSLDDAPLRSSARILISMGAQAVPEAGNKRSFLSEPIQATLILNAPQGLRLFALGPGGKKTALPVLRTDGAYRIRITPALKTWWLMLEKDRAGGRPQ